MKRPTLLAAALWGGACIGCTRGDGGDELYRLRNEGRLEASRDTPEGYRQAAAAFAAVVERGGDATDRIHQAACLILGGEPEAGGRAAIEARRALPAGGEVPARLLYLEALAAKKLQRYDEAVSKLRELTAREPRVEASWFQLGSVHLLQRDYDGAIESLGKVLELQPEQLSALYKLSRAHQVKGQTAQAEAVMARFLELKRREGQGEPEESAQERCRYTRVTWQPLVRSGTEPRPVAFSFSPVGDAFSGACEGQRSLTLLDADRDGDVDLYFTRRGGQGQLWRNDRGRFTDVTDGADAAGPDGGSVAAPGDFDNDTLADLAIGGQDGAGALLRGLGECVFQPEPQAGLDLARAPAVRWVDHDHDGDLDVVSLRGSSSQLVPRVDRNNGDGSFALAEGALPAVLPGAAGGLTFLDLDRGNDVDLVAVSDGGPAQAFLNLRQGPFRVAAIPELDGHSTVEAGDLDGDGELDLVGAPGPSAPLRIAWNGGPVGPGKAPSFRIEPLAAVAGPSSSARAMLADLENDGDLDVLVASDAGLSLGANRAGRIELAAAGIPPPGVAGPAAQVEALDLDQDGALDLVLLLRDGRPLLLRQTSQGVYPAVTLRLTGGRDNRPGVGAQVELLAGRRYQRRQVESIAGAGGLPGARFGLGGFAAEALDGFVILWPNGIEQPLLRGEIRWDKRRGCDVTQKRGLSVSCPFLYVHDGQRYRFLTDIVGIAPLDEWLPPPAAPRLDPEEFVRIPGERLRALGGRLRLAITEELRETTYLDRVELLAVEHPRGTLVYLDESTRQGDREPLEVFIAWTEDLVPLAGATAPGGRDVTAALRAEDHRFAHPYPDAPSQWAGWVPEHELRLRGPVLPPQPGLQLLLRGRIYWPDSSVTFALSQHGRTWKPPRLEAHLADGATLSLLPDLGFPCGMDRAMVVPLDALPAGAPEMSLVTSHRFLWDQAAFVRRSTRVRLDVDGTRTAELDGRPLELRRRTLRFERAELGERGYSRVVGDFERHEEDYDFEDARPSTRFPPPRGSATRHGDVRALLAAADDRLCILVPGDAVWLEADAPEPAAPDAAAAEVTFFLQVTGWAKEANFHNRTGRSIGPLPRHDMIAYPPAAAPAANAAAVERYLDEYQTRRVGEP